MLSSKVFSCTILRAPHQGGSKFRDPLAGRRAGQILQRDNVLRTKALFDKTSKGLGYFFVLLKGAYKVYVRKIINIFPFSLRITGSTPGPSNIALPTPLDDTEINLSHTYRLHFIHQTALLVTMRNKNLKRRNCNTRKITISTYCLRYTVWQRTECVLPCFPAP